MISKNLIHEKSMSDSRIKNEKQSIAINFLSSKDNDEERVMHSISVNIEIMISDKGDEDAKELFDSLKNRYQNNLAARKGSDFVFSYVQLLCYKCHKINPNHGGSYTDSYDWIITIFYRKSANFAISKNTDLDSI